MNCDRCGKPITGLIVEQFDLDGSLDWRSCMACLSDDERREQEPIMEWAAGEPPLPQEMAEREEDANNAALRRHDVGVYMPTVTGLTDEQLMDLQGIINEIREVAENGYLPDGDEVNEPTAMWVEEWAERLKGIRLFERAQTTGPASETNAAYREAYDMAQAANNASTAVEAIMEQARLYARKLVKTELYDGCGIVPVTPAFTTRAKFRNDLLGDMHMAFADLQRMVESAVIGPTTGPASETNAADSTAWDQSRRNCPCADCKAQGRLTCDECGVVDYSEVHGQ